MSNTPSNAEAWDLWLESITGGHHPASLAKFASAVLAKWGTPQPVNLGFTIENRAGIDVLVWKDGGCQPATSAEVAMWKALAAVQQPVVREPLTDEQIDALIATKHFREGYELTASDKVCINWYRLGLRDGERAHGITQKGGS